MTYTITEMFGGEHWVSSHKTHLGYETIDKVFHSLDEAKEFCGFAAYTCQKWYDSDAFVRSPVPQDYRSYAEKELAYDYWQA